MSEEPLSASELLDQIDRRQNDVLRQLDELNAQVESLIARNLPSRQPEAEAA